MSGHADPRFVVLKPSPMIDEPPAVRLVGVAPGSPVRLCASCADVNGTDFTSWAEYVAASDATVDPARARARAGTYEGVDSFGLWWSMSSKPERPFARNLEPITTRLVAHIGGELVALIEFPRLRIRPDIRSERVRDEGLVATLFVPDRPEPAPGVLVLGGSEGGIALAEELAALLATHGFAALALAYFGLPGLPSQLVEIPVEYAQQAARWLARRCDVVRGGIGVVGISRGGELALLLATIEPGVRAVVGFAASGVVWPGFVPGSLCARSAWLRCGRPIAFAVPCPQANAGRQEWLAAALQHRRTAGAEIPLERTRAAVLLISGGDDRIWPARQLAERAMRRLTRSVGARRHCHEHLSFPSAGHGVGRLLGLPTPPTRSSLRGAYDLGGSRSANARSARLAWPRVLAFLTAHLGAPADRPARFRRARAARNQ